MTSPIVSVPVRTARYVKIARSAFHAVHSPTTPRVRKNTVNGNRAELGMSDGSIPRDHCQSKYCQYIWSCAPIGALRWVDGGVWYWTRARLSESAWHRGSGAATPRSGPGSARSYTETAVSAMEAHVGSPSLITGSRADRIGRTKLNDSPNRTSST